MTITYEINPPKIIQDTVLSQKELQNSLNKLKSKALKVGKVCKSIHLTDSVLGIPRISPITAGFFIRGSNKKIKISYYEIYIYISLKKYVEDLKI